MESKGDTRVWDALDRASELLTEFTADHPRCKKRIIVLSDGRIVERGDHQTLLAAGGDYAALYEAQFGGISTAEPVPEDSI